MLLILMIEFRKYFSRGLIIQGFSGPGVHGMLHPTYLAIGDLRKVCTLRKELAYKTVHVLVGSTLPWTVRICEVHLDLCLFGKQAVLRHFLALIIGHRQAKVFWKPFHDISESFAYRLCIVAVQPHQQQVATRSLSQRAQGRPVARSHDQVPFPVSRNGTILYFRWTFMNTDLLRDFAALLRTTRSRFTARTLTPQVLRQLLLQRSFALNIKVGIDRFVRDMHDWMRGKPAFECSGNLLWRPVPR